MSFLALQRVTALREAPRHNSAPRCVLDSFTSCGNT
ncbi:DUF1534 domain-containing protein [Pseudomonas sp. ST1]|nr:DUF1534 domain-containing protein [Pseudomonas savastanoi]TSC33289.1 DUF1534 domain-containing protein [Pseudomonas sp. ST1]